MIEDAVKGSTSVQHRIYYTKATYSRGRRIYPNATPPTRRIVDQTSFNSFGKMKAKHTLNTRFYIKLVKNYSEKKRTSIKVCQTAQRNVELLKLLRKKNMVTIKSRHKTSAILDYLQ